MAPMNLTNIFENGPYYRVKVERNGIKFQVCIPFGQDKPVALQRAIAERDHILAQVGPVQPRSKTGVAGISEITKWSYGRPQPCFSAQIGGTARRRLRRFYYHTLKSRELALKRAIAWRSTFTGSARASRAAVDAPSTAPQRATAQFAEVSL